MKREILIVDWILIVIFTIMVTSKFVTLPFAAAIQPIFFIFILIHVVQHRKMIVASLKGLKK